VCGSVWRKNLLFRYILCKKLIVKWIMDSWGDVSLICLFGGGFLVSWKLKL
jgi:hypothetical protein